MEAMKQTASHRHEERLNRQGGKLDRIEGARIAERARKDKELWLLGEIEQPVKLILVFSHAGNFHFILGRKEWRQRTKASRLHDATNSDSSEFCATATPNSA